MAPREKYEEPCELELPSPPPSPGDSYEEDEIFVRFQSVIESPETTLVRDHIPGWVAKMLIFLENGDQRLITFDVPTEHCTVQDLIDGAGVHVCPTSRMVVSLVNDTEFGINYMVEVKEENSAISELRNSLSRFNDEVEISESPFDRDSPESPANPYNEEPILESPASPENAYDKGLHSRDCFVRIEDSPESKIAVDNGFDGATNQASSETYSPASPDNPFDRGQLV